MQIMIMKITFVYYKNWNLFIYNKNEKFFCYGKWIRV